MVYDSCLIVFGVLTLGFPSAVLNVLVPLMPFFLQFPELFSCVGHVWNYNGDVLLLLVGELLLLLLLLLLVVVVLGWLGWVNLCCHWLRAHSGN